MNGETIEVVLDFLRHGQVETLDVTGGSPEMNPHFRYLMERAKALGVHLMDRCNPTILMEPGYEWVAEFLANLGVEVVASLPCYTRENVTKQRGKGVFDASIQALRRLNELGYGVPESGLLLDLVYNPVGANLPPAQEQLKEDYQNYLGAEYGIRFNQLYALTNMPIGRFGSLLLSNGQFETYMTLLKDAYQPQNLRSVMCRDLISVDWLGYVHDCDFNQMLKMPFGGAESARTHLREIIGRDLKGLPIRIGNHCYACTAGQGSSCGGALG